MKQIKHKKSSLEIAYEGEHFRAIGELPENRNAKSIKEMLFIATVSIGIIMAPFVFFLTEGIALAHLMFLISAAFGAAGKIEKVVRILFKLLIGAGVIQSLFAGVIFIINVKKKNDCFRKHWKIIVIPWVIITILILSILAGQMLGEIPK